MSTPPNPPSTPNGPPTEPADAPVPGAAPVAGPPAKAPAPAEGPSLQKEPAADAPPPAPEKNPFAPPSPDAPARPAPPTGPAAGAGFGPGGPGGAGGPGHPWAQPGAGFGGVPYAGYPGYPQAAPATNGLAVAALVVGITGVLLGFAPFFFWVGAILAATALGLGIGALVRASKGAPRKAMAVTGTVLGVLGLGAAVGGVFLTALVVDEATDRAGRSLDRQDRELIPYPDASPTPSRVPGLTSALPFGETFTYDNGVTVSLSEPKKYQPKGIVAREKVKNAIQITVTITNGSAEPHEVIYAMPNVRDDKGMTAETVFDSGGGVPKMIRGSLLPGETASGIVAFEVPEGTASISADISAGTMLEDVKYTGPVT